MNLKWRGLIASFALMLLSLFVYIIFESYHRGMFQVDYFPVLAALILPGLIAYFFISGFYRRLEEVKLSARNLSRGAYHNVKYPDTSDELGQMAYELYLLRGQIDSIMENAAQEARKIEAILTGMQEGIIGLDHIGRIVLLNRAAESIFKCSQEDVSLKYLIQMINHLDLEQVVDRVLRGGQAEVLESKLESRVVRMEVSPVITDSGRPGGAVIVCHDITELRRLERIRTEFVANVSHELRTPLTSITGFIETLLEDKENDPEVWNRFLEIIQKEALRLHHLIDDLLELSRLENQKTEAPDTHLRQAYIQDSYAEIEPMIRRRAEEKGLLLNIDLSPDLPAVKLGEELLGQLLLNLLENAVKYTQRGKVWLQVTYDDERVCLEVGDTGSGISEDSLPRIFERFYRVDKARSREQGGTGLGLSIVKHILEGCKGKIRVESVIGKGTVFHCDLPRPAADLIPDIPAPDLRKGS